MYGIRLSVLDYIHFNIWNILKKVKAAKGPKAFIEYIKSEKRTTGSAKPYK